MATRKIELPTGEVLRTATKSRYALVMQFPGSPAFIEMRSGSRATLVERLRTRRAKCLSVSVPRPAGFVADLPAGTVEEV